MTDKLPPLPSPINKATWGWQTYGPLFTAKQMQEYARQAVREAVPEGFVVVPLNPTKLMKEVGGAACTLGLDIAHYTYSRMIAAAKEAK